MRVIKVKQMKASFDLRMLIVTLRASSSASEGTPLTTAGMRETEGVLPPVASAALFWLSGALLLCPGCSIVAGGVIITSAGAAAVLAAEVTNKAGVGALVTGAA